MSTEKSPSPKTSVTRRGGAASAISSQRTSPSAVSISARRRTWPSGSPCSRSSSPSNRSTVGQRLGRLDLRHHDPVEVATDDGARHRPRGARSAGTVDPHERRPSAPCTSAAPPARAPARRSSRLPRRRPRGRARSRPSRTGPPSRACAGGCPARTGAPAGACAPNRPADVRAPRTQLYSIFLDGRCPRASDQDGAGTAGAAGRHPDWRSEAGAAPPR